MKRFHILAVTLAFALVAGCGRGKTPSPSTFPEARYIKESAQAVAVMDFNELLSIASAMEMGSEKLEKLHASIARIGLTTRDIERLVFAFSNKNGKLRRLGIIKLKADAKITEFKRILAQATLAKFAGNSYYTSPGQPAIYFDESNRLMVVGEESQIWEALGDGPPSDLVSKLEANIHRSVYLYARVSPSSRDWLAQNIQSLGPDALMFREPAKHLTAVSLIIDGGDNSSFKARFETNNVPSAENLKVAIDAGVRRGRSLMETAAKPKSTVVRWFKEMLDAITTEVSGTTVNVSAMKPNGYSNRDKALNSSSPTLPEK